MAMLPAGLVERMFSDPFRHSPSSVQWLRRGSVSPLSS
jgi:hypothetical protein